MSAASKLEGTGHAPYEKTTREVDHNTALNGLQLLREIAWQSAIKYRWDPVLGRAHQEYLNTLNRLIKECQP